MNFHVHALWGRKKLPRSNPRPRRDYPIEFAVPVPTLTVFNVIYVSHFTLVDLRCPELFRLEKRAKSFPFGLKGRANALISRILLAWRELSPIMYKPIPLQLN